jgi:parvulin-like peptidyl-prolyl isomerase
MDYEEACEAIVSRKMAQREIEKHSADFADFIAEYGDKPSYKGQDVLDWLGY